MTSRIAPIRRASVTRKTARAEEATAEDTSEAEVVRLPVPVARLAPPRSADLGHAPFAAQLIGQDGQKRGLRAGPELLDAAKTTYNRTEFSGAKDRRAPKGRKAKTEI